MNPTFRFVLIWIALLSTCFSEQCRASVSEPTAEPRPKSEEKAAGLSDDELIQIARQGLMDVLAETTFPPVIRRHGGKIVVWFRLAAFVCPDPEHREFPRDWVSVWIDPETKSVVDSPETVLSEEEALAVAREAMSFYNYDKEAAPRVERGSSFYRFTFFNFPTKLDDGETDYVGPVATAWVNVETKALMGILFEAD